MIEMNEQKTNAWMSGEWQNQSPMKTVIPTSSWVIGAGNVHLSNPKDGQTDVAGTSARTPEQERTEKEQTSKVINGNNLTYSQLVKG